jgi:hypothetical protein
MGEDSFFWIFIGGGLRSKETAQPFFFVLLASLPFPPLCWTPSDAALMFSRPR